MAQGTEVEVGVPVLDLTRFVVWDVTNEILRQCPVFLRLEVLQSMLANILFEKRSLLLTDIFKSLVETR